MQVINNLILLHHFNERLENNPSLKTPVIEAMWLLSYGPNMKGDLQVTLSQMYSFFSCGSPITFYR